MTAVEHLYLTRGDLRYALPMADVEEVLSGGVYAPVPCARPHIWGICWRGGRLYPVVCLADGKDAAGAVGVLCRQGGRAAVFLADSAEGTAPLPQDWEAEDAPGLGQALREGPRTLWLPRLEELMGGGA